MRHNGCTDGWLRSEPREYFPHSPPGFEVAVPTKSRLEIARILPRCRSAQIPKLRAPVAESVAPSPPAGLKVKAHQRAWVTLFITLRQCKGRPPAGVFLSFNSCLRYLRVHSVNYFKFLLGCSLICSLKYALATCVELLMRVLQ